jgi:hypothetical protein
MMVLQRQLLPKTPLFYAIGGWNGHEAMTSVEIFNPYTDEWSFGPPLPLARAFHTGGSSTTRST